jgi:hypothetical protein
MRVAASKSESDRSFYLRAKQIARRARATLSQITRGTSRSGPRRKLRWDETTYERTVNEATSEGIADEGETGEIRRDELVS